jgi:arabinogalactan endo-1,4-beta-galactosidase
MKIKPGLIITLIFLINICITPQSEFIKGVDLSTLLQIEDNSGVFKENGNVKDPILIFKDHGIDYVRLKIWHTPTFNYDNLNMVLVAAQRIKSNGLKFLLNIHYSDWWADPANQTKPAAWNGLSFQSLKDSVYQYTKNIIATLKNNNVLPDMVQIGNEIICGMLWNDGRICEQYNTPQQWANLGELLKEGINGVNDAIDINDTVKIMIHTDRGGDNAGARWFYDGLLAQNVQFDILGLSYYPWWHGTLNDLQNNLNDLAVRYGKEIIVVETAYPWTLSWDDNTTNLVGNSSQLLAGYPATVQGQKDFLVDVINIVNNTTGSKGIGVFYWEPDWISTQTFGSPWENLAMFDFSGELLSSISAFDSTLTYVENVKTNVTEFQLYQNYPNPFNPITKISWQSPVNSHQTLRVYDVLGNEVATLVNEYREAGIYEINFDASNLPSGVYIYKLQAGDFTQTRKMTLVK